MIKDFTGILERKTQLAGDVWEFRFAIQNETLEFLPGQYALLMLGTNVRQYSISSSPLDAHAVEFIVEYVSGGLASEFFSALQVGQTAQFKGPGGVFILKPTPTDKIFLATGTGIAPIKSMIETHLAEERRGNLHLYFGLKTRADVYHSDHYHQLAQEYDNFSFTICLSREESVDDLPLQCFIKGHIQDGLAGLLKEHDMNDFEYYICGSRGAVEALTADVLKLGVTKDNVFFERFTL